MQAYINIRNIVTRPTISQLTRAVSTTRYVKVYSKNATANKTVKKEEEPEEVAVENKPESATNIQEFPTTTQFDTGSLKEPKESGHDWYSSFYGLSTERFSKEAEDILLAPIKEVDIEITPDGLLYLPEIKYRRILNKAFGPGGWGLAPRGEHTINSKNISREYALVCNGRFVSQARGEQDYFDSANLPTATEGCKSNALMRCCKDLGIASELWDPSFVRKFKKKHCIDVWAEHVVTKKKKKLWRKKDDILEYPYKEN